MPQYNYCVGIDVSKRHLDYAIVQDGKVIDNKRCDNTPAVQGVKASQYLVLFSAYRHLCLSLAIRFEERRSKHLARTGYPDSTFFGGTPWAK